jgi:hypothetical protein
MTTTQNIQLRTPLRFGIIAGVVSVCASAIGLVVLFGERELIAGVITMGQVLIFAPTAALAYIAARDHAEGQRGIALLYGSLTGVISGIPSAALIEILSFGLPPVAGSLAFIVAMTAVGLIAASFSLLPSNIQRPIFNGLLWTFTIGMFSENISSRVRFFFGSEFNKLIFTGSSSPVRRWTHLWPPSYFSWLLD